MVSWQPPKNPNGIVKGYVIYYKQTHHNAQQHEIPLTYKQHSYLLQGLEFGRQYFVWMRATTKAGPGLETDVIATTTKDQSKFGYKIQV